MASSDASFHRRGVAGILFSPLKWWFVTMLLLIALIVTAWIVDWVLVTRVWTDGVSHLQQALMLELARAERIGEVWNGYPAFARAVANGIYELIFGLTGIQDMGRRFAESAPVSIPDTVLRDTYIANYEAIRVAMIGTQLFGLRLASLTVAIPALLAAYVVAVIDGLMGRAIRRAAGGRESASLYHRAKHLQLVLAIMLAVARLLIPSPALPDWLWMAGVAVIALLARLQWAYYKKHL